MSDDDLSIASIYGKLYVLMREMQIVLLQQPAKRIDLVLAIHLELSLLAQNGHLDPAFRHLWVVLYLSHTLKVTDRFV